MDFKNHELIVDAIASELMLSQEQKEYTRFLLDMFEDFIYDTTMTEKGISFKRLYALNPAELELFIEGLKTRMNFTDKPENKFDMRKIKKFVSWLDFRKVK